MNTVRILGRSLLRFRSGGGVGGPWWTKSRHFHVAPVWSAASDRPGASPRYPTENDDRFVHEADFFNDQKVKVNPESETFDALEPRSEFYPGFEENLDKCQTVQQVLSLVKGRHLLVGHRILALRKLGKMCAGKSGPNRNDQELLKGNRTFREMQQGLDKAISNGHPETLAKILGPHLDISGLDSKFETQLHEKLMEKLASLSIQALMDLLLRFVVHQETDLRKRTYERLLQTALSQWNELRDPQNVLLLMRLVGKSSPDMHKNLQTVIYKLTDEMNSRQMMNLIHELSKANQRNMGLLINAFTFLKQGEIYNLNITDVDKLLRSLSRLGVYDEDFVRILCDNVRRDLPVLNDAQKKRLVSILISLKLLKYKDPELLDNVIHTLFWEGQESGISDAEGIRRIPTETLTSVLVSCAGLNHMPRRLDTNEVVEVILQKMETASYGNMKILLNTVHALVMLQIGSGPLLTEVLQASEEESSRMVPTCLKLRDINFTANFEMSNYTGPTLSDDFIEATNRLTVPAKPSPLYTDVVKTLDSFLPQEKYFQKYFHLPEGVTVGINMVVKSTGEPCPVADFPIDKPLPKDHHWVALEPLFRGDLTLRSEGLTGVKSLQMRQLQSLDYKVVEIRHREWTSKQTLVDKVNFLKERIKQTVSGEKQAASDS